jgi:hypothetical protein
MNALELKYNFYNKRYMFLQLSKMIFLKFVCLFSAVKSQPATIETDDGFGDFLSSPESMAPPPATMNPPQQNINTSPQSSSINTVTQSAAMTTQTQVTTEKKGSNTIEITFS